MITPGTRLVQIYLSATQGQCRPLLSALSEGWLCWVLSVSKRLEGSAVIAPVPARSLGLHMSFPFAVPVIAVDIILPKTQQRPHLLIVAPRGAGTWKHSAALSFPHLSAYGLLPLLHTAVHERCPHSATLRGY